MEEKTPSRKDCLQGLGRVENAPRESSVAYLMDSKPVTDVRVCERMHPRLER